MGNIVGWPVMSRPQLFTSKDIYLGSIWSENLLNTQQCYVGCDLATYHLSTSEEIAELGSPCTFGWLHSRCYWILANCARKTLWIAINDGFPFYWSTRRMWEHCKPHKMFCTCGLWCCADIQKPCSPCMAATTGCIICKLFVGWLHDG